MPERSSTSTPRSSASPSRSAPSAGDRVRRSRLGLLSAVATFLAAANFVPAAHSAPSARAGLPAGDYVALGDSYASGFGVAPYAPGTNVSGGNDCQRSTMAYPHRVSERTGKKLGFHACSGARTGDFYRAKSAWGESAQLDNLGSSTGLVTFSIGGNDAGFAKVLNDCIGGWKLLPFVNCSADRKVTDPVDSALDALRGTGTQAGIRSYDAIMADIASRAPGAKVVAVGYPRMFSAKGGSHGLIRDRCEGVKKVDQRWMVAKTNELNAALKAAALRHGHLFVDPGGAFAGHELCGADGSWFHGVFSNGRFHPTAAGHAATADSVMGALVARSERAAAPEQAEQAPNVRPTGAFTVTRDGDGLSLDASASTDVDGTIADVDWYVQRPDGTEEILDGMRATTTVGIDEPVSVTVVVTDDRGMEGFATQISPAAGQSATDPGIDVSRG